MSIKVLFIYASSEGHTSKIAHYLDQQARNMGFDSQLKNISSIKKLNLLAPLLQKVDCILIGASVHLGQHQSKIKRLLQLDRSLTANKPTVFFSVSLMAASKRAEDCSLALQQAMGFVQNQPWQPEQIWTVPGALPYTRYNWLTRMLMKWIVKRHEGDTDTSRDYVYTNWVELEKKLEQFLLSVKQRKSQV